MSVRFAARSRTVVAVAAAFTLALTACSAGEESTEAPEISSSTVANGGERVAITGTSALKWDPTELTASAGEVTFVVTSEGATHNLIIEELDNLKVLEVLAGETGEAAISLTAGTYTYFCDITGHRDAGMEGTLTVS